LKQPPQRLDYRLLLTQQFIAADLRVHRGIPPQFFPEPVRRHRIEQSRAARTAKLASQIDDSAFLGTVLLRWQF